MTLDPNAPTCPSDHSALVYRHDQWQCDHCKQAFRLEGYCDSCGKALEKLAACGATNWFCTHCNRLKSKSAVDYRLTPTDAL